jgi:hypothetical protein
MLRNLAVGETRGPAITKVDYRVGATALLTTKSSRHKRASNTIPLILATESDLPPLFA